MQPETLGMFYIAKCRPTYVGYLVKHQVKMISNTPKDFLSVLSSNLLKNITPTILDNILMHLQVQNKNATLAQLKSHYQCTHLNVEALFKENIGLTFNAYQNIAFKST
ncbi:hypothetical protein [Formosa algae]|uniref:Uncharacterized protein n=1 Tax=Formosa algae TaxID=225843 RepID=A0A9X1C965_9FLAO|nr:hypothetical protein [Formosa algae]MBP1839643.1 hypothetical protein [Formosa algae]MDQ0334947.1 hypothetical protein [Formosa algae]